MRENGKTAAPYDGKAVANLILEWAANDSIPVSPMKLQKLIYFCHAEFLKITGKSLVAQDFEAWDYGPVSPYIYHEFKTFSKSQITSRALKFDPVSARKIPASCRFDEADEGLLRSFYEFYKNTSATCLSDLSHAPDGPWTIARRLFDEGKNADRRISAALIDRYFARRRPS